MLTTSRIIDQRRLSMKAMRGAPAPPVTAPARETSRLSARATLMCKSPADVESTRRAPPAEAPSRHLLAQGEVDPAQLVLDVDVKRRRDLEPPVLQHMHLAAMAAPPRHHGVVAGVEQRRHMRPEQAEEAADPAVQGPGRARQVDDEAVEHGDDVGGGIPGLAGDP